MEYKATVLLVFIFVFKGNVQKYKFWKKINAIAYGIAFVVWKNPSDLNFNARLDTFMCTKY